MYDCNEIFLAVSYIDACGILYRSCLINFMPKKKTSRVSKKNLAALPNVKDVSFLKKTASAWTLSRGKLVVGGVIILLVAALLGKRYLSWMTVATVNSVPVSRWDMNARLTNRFGTQMLETMIGEQLIVDAATKQSLTVPPGEIDAKIAEIEKGLPKGATLNDSLQMQGITRPEFDRQVRLQLLIDKMLAKEVSVSAEEVDKYMVDNTTRLTASDPAERKVEAEKQVRSQKISERFVEWFTKLKEAAKIQRSL